LTHGARRLADAAVQRCIRQAGQRSSDVDLLINVGVYRERGLGEPALAALIQEDTKLNPGDVAAHGHGTFSFDLDNGGCGVLTAADVIRGLLSSGTIEAGLVTASDSAPGPLHVRDLPFPEAGGALLLGRDDAAVGLGHVRLDTFPEFSELAQGYWEWQGRKPVIGRRAGSNRLVVCQDDGFAPRAAECAAASAGALLLDEGVDVGEIDLLIATPGDLVADACADLLGIDHDRTLHRGEQIGRFHTAQPIAAIELARRSGAWSDARTILLVSAGSGITVASAIYRN
jgi:3-oxoacyl-[acyl-carrier-protein] synthase-3